MVYRESPIPELDHTREWTSFKPGLNRVVAVLDALGNPHREFPHVIVGGTNGKGTVAYNLSRKLPGRCGLYLSPHIWNLRERITLAGQWFDDQEWVEGYLEIKEKCPACDLSFFEWLLVIAVVVFARNKVDYAVFEVGMGGRLDAVNALSPDCSVLTNVSLDHMEYLGDTIEKIAMEKIEIAREGRPFLISENIAEMESVYQRLQEIGCNLILFREKHSFENNETILEELSKILPCKEVSRELILLPGRREKWPIGKGVFVDGAHNPEAWRALHGWIGKHVEERPLVILGCSKNKNLEQLLEYVKPISRDIRVLAACHNRLRPASDWPDHIEPIHSFDSVPWKEKPVLITGSLYLVGFFYAWLVENEPKLFESRYSRVFNRAPIQPRQGNVSDQPLT